jgi:hypothetical protein
VRRQNKEQLVERREIIMKDIGDQNEGVTKREMSHNGKMRPRTIRKYAVISTNCMVVSKEKKTE